MILKTIAFLIVFYYLFKFVGRIFGPFLLAMGMDKIKKQQQKQQNFRQSKKQEEGKITLHTNQKNEKKVSSDLGDYVDFEEVK